jgi:hypothetical protein
VYPYIYLRIKFRCKLKLEKFTQKWQISYAFTLQDKNQGIFFCSAHDQKFVILIQFFKFDFASQFFTSTNMNALWITKFIILIAKVRFFEMFCMFAPKL